MEEIFGVKDIFIEECGEETDLFSIAYKKIEADLENAWHKYCKQVYPLSDKNRANQSEWVYLLYNHESKLFKIGITTNIYSRVSDIITKSGCKITVILAEEIAAEICEHSIIVERYLHEYFKGKRIVGEWFNLSIEDIVFIVEFLPKVGETDQLGLFA